MDNRKINQIVKKKLTHSKNDLEDTSSLETKNFTKRNFVDNFLELPLETKVVYTQIHVPYRGIMDFVRNVTNSSYIKNIKVFDLEDGVEIESCFSFNCEGTGHCTLNDFKNVKINDTIIYDSDISYHDTKISEMEYSVWNGIIILFDFTV